MHVQAMDAVAKMIATSGYIPARGLDPDRLGLDLGGADVNGTARSLFDPAITWLGLDIAPGPGVDIVADARTWRGKVAALESPRIMMSADLDAGFDVVLCTELLEHVRDWHLVLETIDRVLAPGGYAFITCAGTDGRTGRRPHGARGELDPPLGEHYQNVNIERFRRMVERGSWADTQASYNPDPGDIYAWMRK